MLLPMYQPLQGQDLGFSYQAIARNDNGDPITSQNLSVSIQLRRNTANGAIAYEEEHSVQTNSLGLFSLTIGEGSTTSGNFDNLDWGGNTYFVVVGINGSSIGGNRLEAVPYSKVATHMDLNDLQDVDNGTPASGQVLTWTGSEWEAQNAQSGFSPIAGTGIQINGNTITNTGDTNPNNDVTTSTQAGGDISGNFDNLNIRNNTIGTANIINGSITEDDISDGTEIPGPPIGSAGQDLRGTYPNPFVSGLQGRQIQNTAPANGEVLTWDSSVGGGSWTPRAVPSTGGGEPSGAASGDLGGSYPAPTVDGLQGRPIQNIQPLTDQVLTWTGSLWAPRNIEIGAAGGDVTGTYPTLTVDGLQNNPVSNSTPADNQVLTWIAGQWTPRDIPTLGGGGPPTGAAGGDLGGVYPNPSVGALQGNAVSAATPVLNQVLTWNGSLWTPADAPSSGGGPPTGVAGGDLGGAYPNPSVGALQGNAVSAAAPALNQVLTWNGSLWTPADAPSSGGGPPTGVAGGDLGGAYPNPSVGALQGNAVSAATPALNQVLTWNGSLWTPADAPSSGGGPPTGVAGGDLGGAYPNPSVAALQGNTVSAATPTLNQVLTWNGSLWTPADVPTSGGGSPTGAAGGDLGGTYPNPSVAALQGNTVSTATPGLNQALIWDGSQWTPTDVPSSGGGSPTGAADGDLGGTYPNPTVDGLQGNTVSATAPTLDQVLTWNGSAWAPADAQSSGGGSPTGAADGDLGGTYPNPTVDGLQGNTVSATAPTLNQVLTWNGSAWAPADAQSSGGGAPTGAADGDLGGTYPNPTVDGLQGNSVSAAAPTLDQVLSWNGSAWTPSTLNADGDVTGAYDELVVEKIQGQDISTTAPTTEDQVLTWNGSEWAPKLFPSLVTVGGGTNSLGATLNTSSTQLRQAQAVSAITLGANDSQDVLNMTINVSERACALITLGGEAGIEDQGAGGFASLEFGIKNGLPSDTQIQRTSMTLPDGYPAGTSFYQPISLSRKVSIPAGGATITAFAHNTLSGEDISLSNLTLVAHIVTDEANSCNE